MTLLVRNEEDILDDVLCYHLERGVDFVVATDHRSVDGTPDILRRYERDGRLHLIREQSDQFDQPAWVTRMARLAATDFGADWVINSDADEFWWPRDGRLHDILEAVPPRFGALWGFWRTFMPRPDRGEPFYERMVVRRRPVADISSPFAPSTKTVHRADPDVVVMGGNHKAFGHNLVLLPDWLPFEVLHFPIRSVAQIERKYPSNYGRHARRLTTEMATRGAASVYADLLVDDGELADGLASGVFIEDVRLRDALRPDDDRSARPSIADDVDLAIDVDTFRPADSVLRLSWRLEALRARVAALEVRSR